MDIKIIKDEEIKQDTKTSQPVLKTIKPELDTSKKLVLTNNLKRNTSTQSYKNLADYLN